MANITNEYNYNVSSKSCDADYCTLHTSQLHCFEDYLVSVEDANEVSSFIPGKKIIVNKSTSWKFIALY